MQLLDDSAVPDSEYSTAEVELEALRLQRRHYAKCLAIATVGAAAAALHAGTVLVVLADWSTIYPKVATQTGQVPFGIDYEYWFLANVAMWAIIAILAGDSARKRWRRRNAPPEEFVEPALQNLGGEEP